jgi:drug/metabolite transporter (DMT)-like permease
MKPLYSSHFFALLTIFLWSSIYILTKICLEYYSPFAVGLLRYGISGLVLLIVALIKRTSLPQKSDIALVILTGACGFGVYVVLFNLGMRSITSATSSLIVSTTPIITAVFSHLFLGESLCKAAWAAIGLEFIGMLTLTLGSGAVSINPGILWTLAAAVLFSCYQILTRRLSRHYTAFAATAYSIIAAGLMLLVFLPHTLQQLPGAPFKATTALVFMAALPTSLAFVWWAKALSLAKNTSQVTNYMFLTPFITALLGYFILRESLDSATLLGGLLIMAGLIMFSIVNKPQSRG